MSLVLKNKAAKQLDVGFTFNQNQCFKEFKMCHFRKVHRVRRSPKIFYLQWHINASTTSFAELLMCSFFHEAWIRTAPSGWVMTAWSSSKMAWPQRRLSACTCYLSHAALLGQNCFHMRFGCEKIQTSDLAKVKKMVHTPNPWTTGFF